ncbi:hypothetical protein ACFFGH_17375 [Lysobacter korlensis]|uniref:Uncharacterized protein n=1 Tax=Lysobacter korlensis TaxID=553636 RepID=A0ABV6RRK9_9GAMM
MTQHDGDLERSWRLQEQALQRALAAQPGPSSDVRDRLLAEALATESMPPPPAHLVASILADPRLRRPVTRTGGAWLVLAVSAVTFAALLATAVEAYAGGIANMLTTLDADPGAPAFALAAASIIVLVMLRLPGALAPERGQRAAMT